MEERLIELESQAAFQEKLLEELNAVLTAQQKQIDGIEKELQLLSGQIRSLLNNLGELSA